mgnify:CR=1 FL=1
MGVSCKCIGKMRRAMDKIKREQILENEKIKIEKKKDNKKDKKVKGE